MRQILIITVPPSPFCFQLPKTALLLVIASVCVFLAAGWHVLNCHARAVRKRDRPSRRHGNCRQRPRGAAYHDRTGHDKEFSRSPIKELSCIVHGLWSVCYSRGPA